MAEAFSSYPWSSWGTSASYNVTYNYDSTSAMPWQGTWYGQSPIVYRDSPPASEVKMPEGPMEWLKRRVTEVTDLAYAGI